MINQRYMEMICVRGMSGPRWRPTGREKVLNGADPQGICAGWVAALQTVDAAAEVRDGWVYPYGTAGSIAWMPARTSPVTDARSPQRSTA